jgi:hypothetical protein
MITLPLVILRQLPGRTRRRRCWESSAAVVTRTGCADSARGSNPRSRAPPSARGRPLARGGPKSPSARGIGASGSASPHARIRARAGAALSPPCAAGESDRDGPFGPPDPHGAARSRFVESLVPGRRLPSGCRSVGQRCAAIACVGPTCLRAPALRGGCTRADVLRQPPPRLLVASRQALRGDVGFASLACSDKSERRSCSYDRAAYG